MDPPSSSSSQEHLKEEERNLEEQAAFRIDHTLPTPRSQARFLPDSHPDPPALPDPHSLTHDHNKIYEDVREIVESWESGRMGQEPSVHQLQSPLAEAEDVEEIDRDKQRFGLRPGKSPSGQSSAGKGQSSAGEITQEFPWEEDTLFEGEADVLLNRQTEAFHSTDGSKSPQLRRRSKKNTLPSQQVWHGAARVPLARSFYEQGSSSSSIDVQHEARKIDGLQRTKAMEDALRTKAAGKVRESTSFAGELEQSSEISSQGSENIDFQRNKGKSAVGDILGKRSLYSSGEDSDDDDVGYVRYIDEDGAFPRKYDFSKRDSLHSEDDENETTRGRETEESMELDSAEAEADGGSWRETYRTPEENGADQDTFLSLPTAWAIKTLGFQIRLMGQAFNLSLLLVKASYSFVAEKVHKTLEVKERATEAVSQKLTMISQVPPKVTAGGSLIVRKVGWGCLAAAYVCISLLLLLFPTFLLDFIFVAKVIEEPVNIREVLHFDYTQPNPSAVVFLHPLNAFGFPNGKHIRQSERSSSIRAIPTSHKIHVTVMLTLPESDYNRQLGMFQLTVELLSVSGEVVDRSSRPCMLRFHSTPIRLAKTFFMGFPLLVGVSGESQTLVVRLMEYKEQPVPIAGVRILLQPKAGFPVGAGLPELYSAEVHFESRLPRLKELLRNWRWTFYVWSGFALYTLEITIVLCCCRQALVPKSWGGKAEDEASERSFRGNSFSRQIHTTGLQEDRENRRCNRGRRHVSFEENIPTARVTSVGQPT